MIPRDRISAAVRSASKGGDPALVAFLTAGYPRMDRFRDHLRAVAAGADVVEIGVPFTDPMADGVTIQRSSQSALEQGVSLAWILDELEAMPRLDVPLLRSPFPAELSADPIWRVIFGYSPLVYFAIVMVVAVWWFLQKTRAGLILRAVGENDLSAHSIGYPVIGIRYLAVAFGGAMAGIGGSCFPLFLTPQWVERLTAGRGWIALALVVFAAWKPFRLLAGAYFFGLMMIFEIYAKTNSAFRVLPSEFWAALPYLATVLVLVLISLRREGSTAAPACLGKPFVATG